MFLFAPHGIWGLIKESWLGSRGGAEPSYEMLLGDWRVTAFRWPQGPSRAVLTLQESDFLVLELDPSSASLKRFL